MARTPTDDGRSAFNTRIDSELRETVLAWGRERGFKPWQMVEAGIRYVLDFGIPVEKAEPPTDVERDADYVVLDIRIEGFTALYDPDAGAHPFLVPDDSVAYALDRGARRVYVCTTRDEMGPWLADHPNAVVLQRATPLPDPDETARRAEILGSP